MWQQRMQQMSEQVRPDLRWLAGFPWCVLLWSATRRGVHVLDFWRWGQRGSRGQGPPCPPSLCSFPLCLRQLRTLKEEKEQSESRVQELETNLAELRSQMGEWG